MNLDGDIRRISETLLSAVIDTAVDGVMVIDERGVVTLYNSACERLFGYPTNEVVGRNVKMLMPAPYAEEHDGYLHSYRSTGEAQVIGIGREVIGQRKDGSEFPVGLSLGEAWHDDKRYFVGIVRDITEQKLSEKNLLDAVAEAKAANRAKSDFLAVISHEVRTPLHGILATTGLLLYSDLKEKQQQYAETIQQSGEALLEIVDNLLDLSRIEAGVVEIKEARFEIVDLLRSIEYLWESRVREKKLEYFTRIGRGVPPMLVGDADRIREILNNLVNNAIKFTDQGYITIDVAIETVAGRRKDGRAVLCFEVKDTGIGIAPDLHQRLFQNFEQGDKSLTREHEGSGLGLSICKELCALLDGEIDVVSEPGKGSCFWFTVPCALPTEETLPHEPCAAAMPKPDRLGELSTLKVLVAEDNHTNQLIIRDVLEYSGHSVHIAPNGREAVRAASNDTYDLILMDIRMPVMDGLEATRHIRSRGTEARRVPIIAMTAHAMNGVRDECIAAGMDDFISKPFTIAQISEVIMKMADERRPETAAEDPI